MSAVFAAYHVNKRGVTLDISRLDAESALNALASSCDVIVVSPTLRTPMAGFNCEDHTVSWAPANCIIASITPFGLTGPYRDMRTTPFSDDLVAASGALATAAALGEARLHGKPTYLDVGQIDAVAPMLASLYALLLNSDLDGSQPSNDLQRSWLSAIFPSSGADQWFAVDIEDGSDWQQLCEVLQPARSGGI